MKKTLNYILEMMSKIDETYPDNGMDNSENQQVDVNNTDYETHDNDTTDKLSEPDSAKKTLARINHTVQSSSDTIKTFDDVKNFDVKFKNDNSIGTIDSEPTILSKPHQSDDSNDEQDGFWDKKYVDTFANLQMIAMSPDTMSKNINNHLDQFKVSKDREGLYLSNGEKNPASYVPGYGIDGNADKNAENVAFLILLKALKENGVIPRGISIRTPDELREFLITKRNIQILELKKKKQSLQIAIALKGTGILPESTIENIISRIEQVFNGNISDERIDGISNAQAKFLLSQFTGSVSSLNGMGSAKFGDEEFIGLLNWLPEDTRQLRSACYVKRKLTGNKSEVIKDIRNFVFSANRVKYRTLSVTNFGTLNYNENIDDPITTKTVEDLLSEATYILSIAIDNANQKQRGKDATNYQRILGFAKGNSSNSSYSVMDYIINLATILNSEQRRSKSNASTGTRIVFDEVLTKYFSLAASLNSVGAYNGDTIMSVIPFSAFFEENDGLAILNSLLNNGDERTKNVIKTVLSIIESKNKRTFTMYKLASNNGSYDRLDLMRKEVNDYQIVEKPSLTLYELLSEVLGQGKNSTQERLTNAFRRYLSSRGMPEDTITCEWNNDNAGNIDSEVKDIIGKKSIDIALKDYRILIEFQGEQHYTPSCCRGISPDLSGLGNSDLDDIHRHRGRTSDYIRKSLKPGSEQKIEMLRTKIRIENCGQFLKEDNFSDRMTSLVSEILSYVKLKYNKNSATIQKKEFMTYAWEYLGTFVDSDIICDEESDMVTSEEKQMQDTQRNIKAKWTQWGTVTSLASRRRWFEELSVYLQQAADKQKFIKYRSLGWNFFYVCPSGGKINNQLIKEQAEVPFVTDFTSFLDSNGMPKTIDNYVPKDAMVAEGIYRIANDLKPEYMASNYTYRFAESEKLEDMKWVKPIDFSGDLGNKDNLAETVMSIIRQKRGL